MRCSYMRIRDPVKNVKIQRLSAALALLALSMGRPNHGQACVRWPQCQPELSISTPIQSALWPKQYFIAEVPAAFNTS